MQIHVIKIIHCHSNKSLRSQHLSFQMLPLLVTTSSEKDIGNQILLFQNLMTSLPLYTLNLILKVKNLGTIVSNFVVLLFSTMSPVLAKSIATVCSDKHFPVLNFMKHHCLTWDSYYYDKILCLNSTWGGKVLFHHNQGGQIRTSE